MTRPAQAKRREGAGEGGAVLLIVLIFLLVIGAWSSSFIWFMNQQQTREGARYRSTAALRVAEAGVYRALSILESAAPNGSPGRTWRPTAYAETVPVGSLEGRFTLSLADTPEGGVVITSVGEVAGVARALRVRAYLASPALLAGLYGAGTVSLEDPPAATVVLPYGAGIADRPWIHVAAGKEIWFATTQVSINDPAVQLEVGPGPLDPPGGPTRTIPVPPAGPVRLLLSPDGQLTLDRDHQRVDVQQLRMMGVYVEGVVLRAEVFPRVPEVNAAFYRAEAAANLRNAELNEAAGSYLGDGALERKRDSLYTPEEFEKLQRYLKTGLRPPQLTGVIYVLGPVAIMGRQELRITDGSLIADSTVFLSERAALSITHSAATRTLPGIVVLGNGALTVTEEARLQAHGLVYSSRTFEISTAARVDIVGAVVAKDVLTSFFNRSAAIVIRYDPAVLGTPGLRVPEPDPVVAWVAEWEELP